jgi:hypothetical protein
LSPPTITKTTYETITNEYLSLKKVAKGEIYTTCDNIPRFSFLEEMRSNFSTVTADNFNTVTADNFSTITVVMTEIYTVLYTIPATLSKKPPYTHYTERGTPVPYPGCWNEMRTSLNDFANSEACNEINQSAMESIRHDAMINGYAPSKPTPCMFRGYCHMKTKMEVMLIYWPESDEIPGVCHEATNTTTKAVESQNIFAPPRTIITSAITFRGKDLYRRCAYKTEDASKYKEFTKGMDAKEFFQSDCAKYTKNGFISPSVLSGPWTFVSPTVYMAHHAITLTTNNKYYLPYTIQNESRPLTTTVYKANVVPVDKADVFTFTHLYSKQSNWAQLIAQGKFSYAPYTKPMVGYDWYERTTRVPLNFRDLLNPVPATKYYDAREDCMGIQTHCGTISDNTYRPSIVVNLGAYRKYMPENYPCVIPNLVDPAIALTKLPESTIGLASFDLPDITHSSAMPQSIPTKPWNGPKPTEGGQDDNRDRSGSKSDGKSSEERNGKISPNGGGFVQDLLGVIVSNDVMSFLGSIRDYSVRGWIFEQILRGENGGTNGGTNGGKGTHKESGTGNWQNIAQDSSIHNDSDKEPGHRGTNTGGDKGPLIVFKGIARRQTVQCPWVWMSFIGISLLTIA